MQGTTESNGGQGDSLRATWDWKGPLASQLEGAK